LARRVQQVCGESGRACGVAGAGAVLALQVGATTGWAVVVRVGGAVGVHVDARGAVLEDVGAARSSVGAESVVDLFMMGKGAHARVDELSKA